MSKKSPVTIVPTKASTPSPSMSWHRALPFDINDAGYHIFEVINGDRKIRLQVLVLKEGRMWKTDWSLASSLRPPTMIADKIVKTRLRPKFDIDCTAAKKWAESYLLSPLALLAEGLTSSRVS